MGGGGVSFCFNVVLRRVLILYDCDPVMIPTINTSLIGNDIDSSLSRSSCHSSMPRMSLDGVILDDILVPIVGGGGGGGGVYVPHN